MGFFVVFDVKNWPCFPPDFSLEAILSASLGFSAGSLGFWPGFSRISRILGIVAWTTPQAQRHSLDLRGDAALGLSLYDTLFSNL